MNEEVEIIEQLAEEFTKSFGTDKGIAILSSVVCQMYGQTDQKNAMVMVQPNAGVLVITTTLDASDQISDIVNATINQLPSVLKGLEEEGDVEGITVLDGDTGETLESISDKKPKDTTIH